MISVCLSTLLVLFSISQNGGAELASSDEEGSKIIYSVVSGSAHLPCNITPPQGSKDAPRLILWYKDADPQPVYSFDNRYTTPKHWSQDPKFGSRAFFRHSSHPAQLIVSSVTLDDAGVYKCRVDFKQSPTVTNVIELKIIEEPRKPVIMDAEGSAVMGTVGPFRLKQALILVCLVEGGNPKPDVFWYRDGYIWDTELDPSTYDEVLQNTLVISELDRSHHDSTFECQAINNNVTKAPASKVKITLEMPVLSMTIANLPDPVTADVTYQVLCQVTGAQPPPTLGWFLDGIELPSENPRLTHENNLTTSQLMFTPQIKDQGKVLTCTAGNEVFPSVNRSSTLNVYYLPVVHVELEDDNIDPSYIVEGDSITFKCLIQAHPWVWRIVWYRDGEKLVPSDGVIIDEHRLTLKNATKKMSGQYVCSAANVEGDGFSQGLQISINYKPVCVSPTIQRKDDGIDLVCTVDSKPQSTTYRWLFNSSTTTFEIPSAESTMFFSNYKASTDEEHGQVLCWASNGLGEQVHPCVFRVVPLASPAPPKDCRVSNYSATTVEVKCRSGFSGGLDQRFILDVFETVNNSQVLVATNWTELQSGQGMKQEVTLGAWGLLPDSDYILSVRASNQKGESSSVYVGGSTRVTSSQGTSSATWLPINDHKTEDNPRMPLLFVIVGILVTLMIMGALLTAILAVRRRRLAKLSQIEVQSAASSAASSQPTPPNHDNADLQEALLKQEGQPHQPTIQRKVSFREHPSSGSSGGGSPIKYCPECQMASRSHYMTSSPSSQNGHLPPIQKAVVKTFSIDKLRPLCPVCNPIGDVPYPSCSVADLPSPPKLPRNNNFSDDDADAEEVKKLNSELEELQKCLLNGAADLAAYETDPDAGKDTKL